MWTWLTRRRVVYVEPMKTEQLLECFRVEDDNRLLRGTQLVIRGLREIAAEHGEIAELPRDVRAYYAGQMAMARDVEERVLALVEQAQASATGTKQDARRGARRN